MILFHFILARKHNASRAEALKAAFDDAGFVELNRFYNEEIVGASETFQVDYAEVLFATLDGEYLKLHHTHSFQNPAEVDAARKSKALGEALKIRQENTLAEQGRKAAEARLEEAKFAVTDLTKEQEALLAEFDAANTLREEETTQAVADIEAARLLEEERRANAEQLRKEQAISSASSGTSGLSAATVIPPPEILAPPVIEPEPASAPDTAAAPDPAPVLEPAELDASPS